jgi:hypothetical protein
VSLRFGTTRIRNGHVQTGNGVSGRLGQLATRGRDRLLVEGRPSTGRTQEEDEGTRLEISGTVSAELARGVVLPPRSPFHVTFVRF